MKTLRFHWRAHAFLLSHYRMRLRLMKYDQSKRELEPLDLDTIGLFVDSNPAVDLYTAHFIINHEAEICRIIVIRGKERKAEKLFKSILDEAKEIVEVTV